MENKKILLGLTVLATPFVVENLVETNVASANQTATVATQKQTPAISTTAVQTPPVAATAQVAESKQPVATTTPVVTKSSEYVLNKPAKAYVTANDAAKRVNQKATYQAGTYYVYNQNQGMVNISKATGKAGSWINPVDNPNAKTIKTNTTAVAKPTEPTQPAPTTSTQIVGQKTENGKYTLTNPTPAYVNAVDASKKVNAKGTVAAGNYHIFREYQGMLNVSKAKGKVGSWINPGVTTPAPVTTKPETPVVTKPTVTQPTVVTKTPAGLFTITSPTEAYVNAVDASKKVNARGRVLAGDYHIFREYKGMLNVSKAKGKAGSWINPGVVTTTTPAPVTTKPETKPTTPVQTETKPTPQPTTNPVETPAVTKPTVGTKTSAGLFTITSSTEAYVNAVDASKKVNARGRVLAGDYHIFREYKGMLNVSKAKGKAGSWINPGVVPATTTPTPVTTKPEAKPTTNTQAVGNKTNTGLFTLTSPTEVYVNAADASKKVNARGRVAAGDYHIFREYNGMLNISKAKGKVGSWINPGLIKSTTPSKSRPDIKPAINIGGVITPEYIGQREFTLKDHQDLWKSAVAKNLGATNPSQLEIKYFDSSQAAVYFQDRGALVVKFDPYRRNLTYFDSGITTSGSGKQLNY